MNLIRLRIQHFRSLYNVELELKPLTILIGPNAGGKSNLFKALRLLYDGVAGDMKDWQAYSGQMDQLFWYGNGNGKRPDQLEIILDFIYQLDRTWKDAYENGRTKVQYGVIFKSGNYLEVAREWLHWQWRADGSLDTEIERNGLTIREPGIEYESRSPRTLRLREGISETPEKELYEYISGWRFFDPNPKTARLAHFIPQYPEEIPALEGDASNLSAFLYALQQLQPDDFEAVVEAINRSIELPDQIKMEHDGGRGGQNARYGFVEKSFGETRFIPPESISDGTIKLLAHLALLLADQSVTLACLEEPDTGLHPRMMIHLADAMRQAINRELVDEAGNKFSPQVILTTHSPEFMDCFDLAQEVEYLQVYLVERNELGQTIFTPATAGEFAPWLEKYRLGEAVRRRFI